jgi:drug/metabolite transporter (DMT)-like permease
MTSARNQLALFAPKGEARHPILMQIYRKSGYLFVALAATAWGTWPIFLRRAEAGGRIHPAVESALVMSILTLVSGVFCIWDRVRSKASFWQWGGIVWLGIADAMNVVLFFRAYQTTSVAVAVTTHYLAPLFVALAAPLVLGEPLTRKLFGAVALSFVGLLLLLAPRVGSNGAAGFGALFGSLSAAFYASNVLVNKRITNVFSGSELSFYHGLVATPWLLAMVPSGGFAAVSSTSWGYLLAGSLFAGAFGGLMFVWGLRRVDATRASNLTFLEPLVATACASILLGERLSIGRAAGGALILAGAAWVIGR